jgi:cytochrome c oxidase subunit 1
VIEQPAWFTREHYLNVAFGWKSWLLTTDHKRVALLYLITITFFFFLGGAFATMIRLELLTPAGDLFESETYNKLFTMHGIIMVFFFLIPAVPAVLGNFLVPLMIGARDLAFPKLNLFSWYLFVLGGALALWSVIAGGVDTGWTFYTPYSSMFSNTHVVVAVVGILLLLVDTHGTQFHRHGSQDARLGMTWFRLPLFIWSHLRHRSSWFWERRWCDQPRAVVLERLGCGRIRPALGGDPIPFQHFLVLPSAVYIMVLPARCRQRAGDNARA